MKKRGAPKLIPGELEPVSVKIPVIQMAAIDRMLGPIKVSRARFFRAISAAYVAAGECDRSQPDRRMDEAIARLERAHNEEILQWKHWVADLAEKVAELDRELHPPPPTPAEAVEQAALAAEQVAVFAGFMKKAIECAAA